MEFCGKRHLIAPFLSFWQHFSICWETISIRGCNISLLLQILIDYLSLVVLPKCCRCSDDELDTEDEFDDDDDDDDVDEDNRELDDEDEGAAVAKSSDPKIPYRRFRRFRLRFHRFRRPRRFRSRFSRFRGRGRGRGRGRWNRKSG